jgi:hypothetical protein
MPKITKRKANKPINEEDQPVITVDDKSKSAQGIKRKASTSIEKVKKYI